MKKLLILFVLILSILDANIDDAKKAYYAKNFKKALHLFTQLSKEGNIESNYYLGTMYAFPYGVKQDYKKAFDYYTIATNKPNKRRLKSIFNIALMYSEGWGVKQDYKKSFELLKTLDKKNVGMAQYLMGRMYNEGKGIERDIHKSIAYLEKGCENNVSQACFDAGYFYEHGIDFGIDEIYPIVKNFYEKGCKLGSKDSCEALKNIKDPLSFYERYQRYILYILLLFAFWRLWRKKQREGFLDEKKNTLK